MSDVYADLFRCRVALAYANKVIEAQGNKKKLHDLSTLQTLAQFDIEEAAQILGVHKPQKDNSGSGLILAIAAVMFLSFLLVINEQMSEIGNLNSQLEECSN